MCWVLKEYSNHTLHLKYFLVLRLAFACMAPRSLLVVGKRKEFSFLHTHPRFINSTTGYQSPATRSSGRGSGGEKQSSAMQSQSCWKWQQMMGLSWQQNMLTALGKAIDVCLPGQKCPCLSQKTGRKWNECIEGTTSHAVELHQTPLDHKAPPLAREIGKLEVV